MCGPGRLVRVAVTGEMTSVDMGGHESAHAVHVTMALPPSVFSKWEDEADSTRAVPKPHGHRYQG